MKCVICKSGETGEGYATVTLQRGKSTIIIKDVPAQVCENCGEYYLSEDVSSRVMAIADNAIKQNAEVEILSFAA
jgi:YgiT-type zinc finger domain-containing protein